VVDDTLLRIGSSNLSNRSMGLDTECDLAIEAAGDASIERTIAHFRDRLLGEHLGATSAQVAEIVGAKQSLIAAVERLSGAAHTLEPLNTEVPTWHDRLLPDGKILDPERPIVPERLIEPYIPEANRELGGRRLMRSAIFLLMLVGLAAAWRWTALGHWFDVATLVEWIEPLRDNPLAPLVVLGAYLVGGLVVAPITVMIIATAIAFGPLLGFTYSLLGCLLSAMLSYAIGSLLGRDAIQRLAGAQLSRLSHKIARHGLTAILLVRIVPVAPFTVINVIAGASHVRVRDFVLGTFLGMFPGLVVMTLFGDRLDDAIRDPKAESFMILVALVVVIVVLTVWLRRRFVKPDAGAATESPADEGEGARLRCRNAKKRARGVFGGIL
jgi:phospholipase D1/2